MLERVVTYEDWVINIDTDTQKYYVETEDGVCRCELVALVEDSDEYTEEELVKGVGVTAKDFDYSGEFDKGEFNYRGMLIFKYGYWKVAK